MFKKRLLAYIIDVFILSAILSVICSFIPISDNITNLNNDLVNINNSFINNEIELKTYINRYFNVIYNMDKELFINNLISAIGMVCILLYILYIIMVRVLVKK